MGSYFDGDILLTPFPNGAAQVSIPLIQDQEYHCRIYSQLWQQRNLLFAPVIGDQFTYTNLLLWSEDFENAAWSKAATVVTNNVYTDPEGNLTAAFLSETTDNSPHSIIQDPGITDDHQIGASVWLRTRQRRYAQVRISNATDGRVVYAVVDLLYGQIISSGTDGSNGVSADAQRMSDSWCLITLECNPTVGSSVLAVDILDDFQSASYPGTAGVGIFIWRATLNPGPLGPSIKTLDVPRIVTGPLFHGFNYAQGYGDTLAFLVDESAPDTSLLEMGIAQWTRTFARVSKRTATPTSIVVSKPGIEASYLQVPIRNSFYVQPIDSSSYELYSVTAITGDTGPAIFLLTGGAYNLIFGSDTTSDIAYNASASDVQTALNALSSISNVGGCTVSGDVNSSFTVTLTGINPITIDNTLLTVDGSGGYAIQNYYQSSGIVDANVYQAWSIYAYDTPGTPTRRNINGGTYTITLLSQTTAPIPYNADSDTIKAALEALSNVSDYGGVTMFNTPYGQSGFIPALGFIYFAFQLVIPSITADVTALTPAGAVFTNSEIGTAYNLFQTLTITPGGATRTIFAENHGASSGGQIFVESITTPATAGNYQLYIPVTMYNVIDQNTLQLYGPKPIEDFNYMIDPYLVKMGVGVVGDYQPGPVNARATKFTDYYLPGITLGIESAADIPIPQSDSDTLNFFEAIIAGAKLNYVVGELSVWKGPILANSTTVVDAFDIVTYITPQIRVTLVGTGSGQVYSNPAGINTNSSQFAGFNTGTVVSLSAIAQTGSAFVKWSGAIGNNSATANPLVIIATGSIDISCEFVLTG